MQRKKNCVISRASGIIFLLVVLFLLTGCKDSILEEKELVGVTYPAFFSKRDIIVPVKLSFYLPSSDRVEFGSKSSLEQIGEALKSWDSEVNVKVQGRSLFISSKNPDTGKEDYYYIYEYEPAKRDHRYVLSNFMAIYMEEENQFHVNFIVPIHLLAFTDDDPLRNIGYGNGKQYEMVSGATIEDVYNFYHDSGYYEAEWNGEQVILKQAYFENITESNGYVRNYQLDRPIVIKVWEEDSKAYFTCQVEGEEV